MAKTKRKADYLAQLPDIAVLAENVKLDMGCQLLKPIGSLGASR